MGCGHDLSALGGADRSLDSAPLVGEQREAGVSCGEHEVFALFELRSEASAGLHQVGVASLGSVDLGSRRRHHVGGDAGQLLEHGRHDLGAQLLARSGVGGVGLLVQRRELLFEIPPPERTGRLRYSIERLLQFK